MSDDVEDFDMEIVEEDELDEMGSKGASSSDESAQTKGGRGMETAGSSLEVEKTDTTPVDSGSEDHSISDRKKKSSKVPDEKAISDGGIEARIGPKKLRLPSTWSQERLSDVFSLTSGVSYSSDEMSDDAEGVRLLTLKSVSSGGGYNRDSEKFYIGDLKEEHRVRAGDLVIANTDVTQSGNVIGYPARVPNFGDEKTIGISLDLSVLRPQTERINKVFAEYLLQTEFVHSRMRAFSAGSTVLHLNLDLARSLTIPVPPLPEQRKIASVLYTVDQAIQKTEAVIEQAQRVKRGLMQDLLKFGITEEGDIRNPEEAPDEFRETALGKVPKEWSMTPLREACHEIVDSPHSTPAYAEEGVLIVRTSDIDEGRFVPDEAKRVTEEAYRERISRLKPEPGDVVFTREAPVGEAFRIPEGTRLCLGQRTMVLRSREDVLNPEFLVHSIYSYRIQKRFDQLVVGTTNPHLNVGTIRNFKIPIPDLDEQSRIVSVLSSVDDEIDVGLQRRNRLSQLKKGLMQDLLTGEVRTADKAIDVLEEVEAHG
jgi:type I restriction enzyme S subunit